MNYVNAKELSPSPKDVKRKRLRYKKINFITVFLLRRRGRKDKKKKILRPDVNGNFISPFIIQEVSLCYQSIEAEKEFLAQMRTNLLTELEALKYIIKEKNNKIIEINSDIKKVEEEPISNIRMYGEEDLPEELVKNLRSHEKSSDLSSKLASRDVVNEFIEGASAQVLKYEFSLDKENEVTKLRCIQLYEHTVARISAYWTGVLQSDGKIEVPALFDTDKILKEIKERIEM